MFPILLLLFIFVPIIEIGLFIQVGGFLGLWPTIALVLITAFVGAFVAKAFRHLCLCKVDYNKAKCQHNRFLKA